MKFMLGNEAVALSAYNSGVRAATSYPGTPSTEIMETMMRLKMEHCEWSVNEKVALEVAAGYAMSGVPSMCSMKNVGLNVASDALMTLSYVGVNAPLLIVVVDTPGCFSSQNEQDTRWYGLAAKIPVFEPDSVQDAVSCVSEAFRASGALKVPVIIRLTTAVSHGGSGVRMTRPRRYKGKKGFVKDRSRYVMIPKNALEGHRKLCETYERARKYAKVVVEGSGRRVAVATGVCASAVRDIGGVKLVEVKGIPFDESQLSEALDGAEEVMVFEQGDPIIEDMVIRLAKSKVTGRRSGAIKPYGELKLSDIREIIAGCRTGEGKGILDKPPRMCAGCPHLATFFWLRNTKKVLAGDIGCYGLGHIDTCVCMGSSMGIGQALENSVVIIGDSTFFHSGIPPLINAVNQKRNLMVVVMDNSTTAMTGNQPVPPLRIERIAEACGAKAYVIDPRSARSKNVIEKAIAAKGVNVVVSKAPCARGAGKRKKYRITSACTNCGLCREINCPAIENSTINELCAGCGFCAGICPAGAIK